jgi:hypothetical protein
MKFKISAITTVTMFGVGICIAASGRFGTSHAPMPTPPIPPAPVGGYN